MSKRSLFAKSVKKFYTKFIFKLFYLNGYRGLRISKFFCCAAKAFLLCNFYTRF